MSNVASSFGMEEAALALETQILRGMPIYLDGICYTTVRGGRLPSDGRKSREFEFESDRIPMNVSNNKQAVEVNNSFMFL